MGAAVLAPVLVMVLLWIEQLFHEAAFQTYDVTVYAWAHKLSRIVIGGLLGMIVLAGQKYDWSKAIMLISSLWIAVLAINLFKVWTLLVLKLENSYDASLLLLGAYAVVTIGCICHHYNNRSEN